jgi:hypothetical protein
LAQALARYGANGMRHAVFVDAYQLGARFFHCAPT